MNEQRIPSVGSLERMIPETIQTDEVAGMQALRLHVERYEFALRHVKGLVGDIACGSGFGSKILAQKGEQVLGVDLDQDVINYATRSYNDSNIHYICADAMQLTHEPFDVIVSFETVEHVPRPKSRWTPIPTICMTSTSGALCACSRRTYVSSTSCTRRSHTILLQSQRSQRSTCKICDLIFCAITCSIRQKRCVAWGPRSGMGSQTGIFRR